MLRIRACGPNKTRTTKVENTIHMPKSTKETIFSLIVGIHLLMSPAANSASWQFDAGSSDADGVNSGDAWATWSYSASASGIYVNGAAHAEATGLGDIVGGAGLFGSGEVSSAQATAYAEWDWTGAPGTSTGVDLDTSVYMTGYMLGTNVMTVTSGGGTLYSMSYLAVEATRSPGSDFSAYVSGTGDDLGDPWEGYGGGSNWFTDLEIGSYAGGNRTESRIYGEFTISYSDSYSVPAGSTATISAAVGASAYAQAYAGVWGTTARADSLAVSDTNVNIEIDFKQ